jgi:cysteinyl-tRNA synthetase
LELPLGLRRCDRRRPRYTRPPAVAHAAAGANELTQSQRRALLLGFDLVLGLDLSAPVHADGRELPAGAGKLLERRAAARAARDYATSDCSLDELAAMGVQVRDTPDGQVAAARS